MAQLVKNLPAVQESWVPSLGWGDPLEKGKASHSGVLAWRIPWGHKDSDMTRRLSVHFTSFYDVWCHRYIGTVRGVSELRTGDCALLHGSRH